MVTTLRAMGIGELASLVALAVYGVVFYAVVRRLSGRSNGR